MHISAYAFSAGREGVGHYTTVEYIPSPKTNLAFLLKECGLSYALWKHVDRL